MSSNALLVWGSSELTQPEKEPEGAWFEASADGTDWGNAQAVVTAIRSHLQDGSLAEVTSYNNRTATVRVRVCAYTYEDLERGASALVAEANVPGYSTLLWTPNRMLATPTVFDVVHATTSFEFDDLSETLTSFGQVLRRTFVVTFECRPFGRDVEPTMVQATAGASGAPVVTSIADGSSATGWSAGVGATVSAAGGRVTATAPLESTGVVSLTYSATVDVSSTRFVFFDFATSGYLDRPAASARAVLGSTSATMRAIFTASVPGGLRRAYFQVPPSLPTSLSSMQLILKGARDPSLPATLSVDQVSKSTALPPIGTDRQRSRTLQIGGSARAQASLVITAGAGTTLGDLTYLYTRTVPTGMQPPLRTYMTAGGLSASTAAPSLMSGYSTPMGSQLVFLIPANLFREGGYSLSARMKVAVASAHLITATAALVTSAGVVLPETQQSITTATWVNFQPAGREGGGWQVEEIAFWTLPTVPVADDSSHAIRITLQADSADVLLDEAWLFNLDDGAVTWVETAGLTRLEVRTADRMNPEPSLWGSTADGGAAVGMVRADYRSRSMGDHVLPPGATEIFTGTSNTLTSSCSATYYRAHLNHATPREDS